MFANIVLGCIFFSTVSISETISNDVTVGDAKHLLQQGLKYQYSDNPDLEKAFSHIRRSAEAGYDEAQFALAQMYEEGIGVKADIVNAIKWYTEASNNGHLSSQFTLASLYEEGLKVEKNTNLAIKYFQLAASQNDLFSIYKLAVIYETGSGLDKDYSKAIALYESAAKKDSVYAQNALGRIFENGDAGVSQNMVEALKWYIVAAEHHQEHSAIQNRDRLSKKMSKEQVMQAFTLAKELRNSGGK